jgi:hypothetical protein
MTVSIGVSLAVVIEGSDTVVAAGMQQQVLELQPHGLVAMLEEQRYLIGVVR